MTTIDLSRFEMRRAPTLDALCELVAARHANGDETILLAGGTDWMVEQEMRPPVTNGVRLPVLVDVSRLEALRGIAIDRGAAGARSRSIDGDILRIGAGATYLEIRRSDVILARAPLLARMAADVGAIQIQARGTLGGNLATASPAADGVAGIAAFDPTIVVKSVRGERRIAFADLQTGYKKSTRAPDEVIVAIEIALPPQGSPWLWRKVGTRRAQAISKVALGAIAVVDAGTGRLTRVGFGMASVAATTALLPKTRALLLERPLAEVTDADLDAAVASDVSPLDDIRSTGDYRLHCARAVVRGFVSGLRTSAP